MSKSIDKLSASSGESIFYDPGFCSYLESYMKYIRDYEVERIIYPETHNNYVYEGDLYGLLDNEGVDRKYHWLIMRVNDFNTPQGLDLNNASIIIPKLQKINSLAQFYKMTQKK